MIWIDCETLMLLDTKLNDDNGQRSQLSHSATLEWISITNSEWVDNHLTILTNEITIPRETVLNYSKLFDELCNILKFLENIRYFKFTSYFSLFMCFKNFWITTLCAYQMKPSNMLIHSLSTKCIVIINNSIF